MIGKLSPFHYGNFIQSLVMFTIYLLRIDSFGSSKNVVFYRWTVGLIKCLKRLTGHFRCTFDVHTLVERCMRNLRSGKKASTLDFIETKSFPPEKCNEKQGMKDDIHQPLGSDASHTPTRDHSSNANAHFAYIMACRLEDK